MVVQRPQVPKPPLWRRVLDLVEIGRVPDVTDQDQFVIGQRCHGLGEAQLVLSRLDVADVEHKPAPNVERGAKKIRSGPLLEDLVHTVVDRCELRSVQLQNPGQGVAFHLRVGDHPVCQRELMADFINGIEVPGFFGDPEAGGDDQGFAQVPHEVTEVHRAADTRKKVNHVVLVKARIPQVKQGDIDPDQRQMIPVGQQLDFAATWRVKRHRIGGKQDSQFFTTRLKTHLRPSRKP